MSNRHGPLSEMRKGQAEAMFRRAHPSLISIAVVGRSVIGMRAARARAAWPAQSQAYNDSHRHKRGRRRQRGNLVTTLYTVGHSNHSPEHFLALLHQHGITAIADVRSTPYSRYCPHFNPAPLTSSLARAGITYVFLGKELGARPDDQQCYVDRGVDYGRVAARPEFRAGLERVVQGLAKFRLALMCTEKDPLDCHRMILVCRHLRSSDITINHILPDASIETNEAAERRLCDRLDLRPNLFESQDEVIEQAYARQGKRISFRQSDDAEAARMTWQ